MRNSTVIIESHRASGQAGHGAAVVAKQTPRLSSLAGAFILLAIIGPVLNGVVYAQCPTAELQCRSSSTNVNKCGFYSFTNVPPLRYLNETTTETENIYGGGEETGGGFGGTWTAFAWTDEECHKKWKGTYYPPSPNSCTLVNNYTGSLTEQISQDSDTGPPIDTTTTGAVINSTTGQWEGPSDLNEADSFVGSDFWFTGITNDTEKTVDFYGISGDVFIYTDNYSQVLDTPYDDKMMRDLLIGSMPAYPTGWPGGNASYDVTPGTNSGDHTSCAGSRMQYQFVLHGGSVSTKPQNFILHWIETTTYYYPTNIVTTNKSLAITVKGNPDGQIVGQTPVDVPPIPSRIDETGPVSVTAGSPSPPGSGGPGGGN